VSEWVDEWVQESLLFKAKISNISAKLWQEQATFNVK